MTPTTKDALREFSDNLKAVPRRVMETAFRTGPPTTDRTRSTFVFGNVFLHLHAVRTHRWSLKWTTTMGLGIMSVSAFLIALVTGVMLMFYYKPYPEAAYQSIKDIHFVVPTGRLIRNLHRWSANLMVIAVILHMARAFYTAAYRKPREYNWLMGIGLLVVTLGLSFTGYLLPWDQLAYWAITVGTNIASAAPVVGPSLRFVLLGGSEIDQNALIRFYVLHVAFLPGLLFFLFAYHMWRVRKDGGLAVVDHEARQQSLEERAPVKSKTYSLLGVAGGASVHVRAREVDEEKNSVPSAPHLVRRVWLVTIGTFIVVLLLSLLFRAPLESAANPSVTPNPAKAPWYVLWLQEIVTLTTLSVGSFTINGAFLGGIVLPGVLVFLALWWPFRDRSGIDTVGVWLPRERRWQNSAFIAICLLIILFTFIGTFMRGPYWTLYWPWESWPDMPVKF